MLPIKILVIENTESIRKDIIEVLCAKDYDVNSATSIALGVKAAQVSPPDIIICNILMPESDDLSVLDSLRKNDSRSWVPFIFLVTKNSDGLGRIRNINWKSDDFISMPFTAQELYAAILSTIDKQDRNKRL